MPRSRDETVRSVSREPACPVRTFGLAVALLALFCTLPAVAEISVSRGADGALVIRGSGPPAASTTGSRLYPIPEESWRAAVEEHGRRHDVDPKLAHAVMQVESAYDPVIVSHKGAVGLMQLMPTTARTLRVVDPYEPLENIRGGIEYLRRMLDRFGDRLELALAAYNAGPGTVERYGGIPPYRETRTYVGKILRLYREPERIRYEPPEAPGTVGWSTSVGSTASSEGREVHVRRDSGRGIVITTAGR